MQRSFFIFTFFLFVSCSSSTLQRRPASLINKCRTLLQNIMWKGLDLNEVKISETTIKSFPKEFQKILRRSLRNYSGEKEVIGFAQELILTREYTVIDGPISVVIKTIVSENKILLDIKSIRISEDSVYGETIRNSKEYRTELISKIGKFVTAISYYVEYTKKNYLDVDEVVITSLDILNKDLANELFRLGFVEMITKKSLSKDEVKNALSFMNKAPVRPKLPVRSDYSSRIEYKIDYDHYQNVSLPKFEDRFDIFLKKAESIAKRLSVEMRIDIK